MRKQLTVLGILLHLALPAPAQVSFGFGFQSDNISISLLSYPNLVRVPGYPVYYAAGLNSNYFFYDGLYWVFETDRWYSSSWYNGPWMMVDPAFIPVFLLQVPVRYYRRPPAFFVGWQANSPPRWNEHWGDDWARQRSGWDRRNRQAMPAPAPLPTYQRQYTGDHYPSAERQSVLQNRNYRHDARDPLVRRQSRESPAQSQQPDAPRHEPAEVSPRGHTAPAAERQHPASPALIKEQEPTITPQAPNPQRGRYGGEPGRQPQATPRTEERPAPRAIPQVQQEGAMRPQPESNRQRGAQPNEERSAHRSEAPGQRRPQRDNADERGQARGRRE